MDIIPVWDDSVPTQVLYMDIIQVWDDSFPTQVLYLNIIQVWDDSVPTQVLYLPAGEMNAGSWFLTVQVPATEETSLENRIPMFETAKSLFLTPIQETTLRDQPIRQNSTFLHKDT